MQNCFLEWIKKFHYCDLYLVSEMKKKHFGIYKKFNGLWEKQYPNWLENEVLQVKWAELVRDLGADNSDKKISAVFKHVGKFCLLEDI